jgi:hypothetical protein
MKIKILTPLLVVLLSVTCILTACQSRKALSRPASGAALETRNNAYSLLHQLLDEQKDVGMLRFIKREDSDVKSLVRKIANNCAAGAKLLEEYASHDPSIKLNETRLPPGEAATRDAIGATKKKELLSQTGDEFELTLLLSQSEALCYAWHLAKVIGENESQADRVRALEGIRKDMEQLYHEVFVLLLTKTK